MSGVLEVVPFVNEDIKKDIMLIQKMVYETNKMDREDRLSDWKANGKRKRLLNAMLTEFNSKQRAHICHNSSLQFTNQLLPLYQESRAYIQAEQKIHHGMEFKIYISYQEKRLGFSELFKSQVNLQKSYTLAINSFSKLAYYVYENTKTQSYGADLLVGAGVNPYLCSQRPVLFEYEIDKDSANSITRVTSHLTNIFHVICGDDIGLITSKIARSFIYGVCCKLSVEELIDRVFRAYVCRKKRIDFDEQTVGKAMFISCHPSWCIFRGKDKNCVLLNQPCHTSVECAFYREDSAKKAHLP